MAVVDLQKTQRDASFVLRTLKRFGIAEDIGEAIAAMARMVRDHRHLESILSGVDGERRQQMYDSIRPHLRFEAKPLDAYVAAMGRRAEAEQLPVQGPDGKLREFSPARDIASIERAAERAIARELEKRSLTLVCAKCSRQQSFSAVGEETHVDVVLKARKIGWVYDYLAEPPVEICPACPTSLRPTGQ